MQITQIGPEERKCHPLFQECGHHFTAVVMGAFCLAIWGFGFPLALFAQEASNMLPPPPSPEFFVKSPDMGAQPTPPPGDTFRPEGQDPAEFKPQPSFAGDRQPSPPGGPNGEMQKFNNDFGSRQGAALERGSQTGEQQFNKNGSGEDQDAKNDERQAKDQARREAEQLRMTQRSIKGGVEQGVKMFQKQLDKLTKQGIAPPAELTAKLQKASSIIEGIKSAKTLAALEGAGPEELMEIMQELQESHQVLEQLARWPKVIKELDRQTKSIERLIKQDKPIVAKLGKNGFDLSDVLANVERGLGELNAIKVQGTELLKTDPSGAYEYIEDNFYDKMSEVMENERVIKSLASLSKFSSEMKRGMAQAEKTITSLERKKIDTSELKEQLEEMRQKGKAVQDLLTTKPIDPDAVVDAMQELESLRHEFDSGRAELSGEDIQRPWEGGRPQFQSPSKEMMQFMPQGGQGNARGGGPTQQFAF